MIRINITLTVSNTGTHITASVKGTSPIPHSTHFSHASPEDNIIRIKIRDKGVGIEDIEKAMEPLFTTKPEEDRSGLGFSFMEAFMDELEVESVPGEGTLIRMQKEIGYNPWIYEED